METLVVVVVLPPPLALVVVAVALSVLLMMGLVALPPFHSHSMVVRFPLLLIYLIFVYIYSIV